MKKYNFGAGPGILPESVFEQAAQAVKDFNGKGLSLLEISHRSADFEAVMEESRQLVKRIFNLNDGYQVLFLQGGASMQFCMVPYNLLPDGGMAAYVNTGAWSKAAIKEAKLFGNANVVASSEDKNFNYIPKGYTIPSEAAYFHITTNNTIFGTEYHQLPQTAVPLVADMSSDIFSRVIDANQYSLIYAGAQKNLGPAGATLVILKDELLGKVQRPIPTMLNYRTHIDGGSMFNTPPVFAIYVCMLTLRWIEEQGGLAVVEATNVAKAERLYAAIDENPLFQGTAAKEDRSRMNVTFVATNPDHEKRFDTFSSQNGIVGLKGHRSVGGFRASIYNALPLSSVDHLCQLMDEFATVNA